jgi:hypothetical protein
MSSADRRRAFPPNVEWSIQHDGILEELVYGDYVANGPPKTHRDVDPSLKKPYLTEELFCSMAGGWTTYELIEAYKSTDVAATEARRARDTAQRERMEAQSASQAAYRENQEVGSPTCHKLINRFLKLPYGPNRTGSTRKTRSIWQPPQCILMVVGESLVVKSERKHLQHWEVSNSGQELPRISELTNSETSGAI